MITKWFNKSKKNIQDNDYSQDLVEKCSVYYIPCDSIRPNAMRSRCDFNEDELIKLAYSIKRYGVIEPITVRQTDIDDSYDYELITGERRLRAAKLANLSVIPCIILNFDDLYAAEMSVIENIYFEPLNYFEVAAALKRIKDLNENEYSFDELASRLSISQSDLLKKLWLLELDYNERQILLNMNVSEDIAVGIAQISDKSQRHTLIESICGEGLDNAAIRERIDTSDYVMRDSSLQNLNSSQKLPRDIASVISGLQSKIKFLNRHKNRAEIKISRSKSTVTATVRIKL